MIRLYEDIDCCINASHNARAWRRPDDDVNAGYMHGYVAPHYGDDGVYHPGTSMVKYKMEWNSRLIDALNELDVELVWATTWREDAREVGKLVGLTHPNQRVLHPMTGITTFPSIDWKWAAILQEQELDPSPFIAVDDEWDDVTPFQRESLERLGGLLISPDKDLGISPAHIEQMKKYIADHLKSG